MIYILNGTNGGVLRDSAAYLAKNRNLPIAPMRTTLEKRVYDKDDEFIKYVSPQEMYNIKKSPDLLSREKVSRLSETYENAWLFEEGDFIVCLYSAYAVDMAKKRCDRKRIEYSIIVADAFIPAELDKVVRNEYSER